MKQRTQKTDPLLKELVRIRNLLMLDLLSRGASSADLDHAVQMGDANIRRLFPVRTLRRIQAND